VSIFLPRFFGVGLAVGIMFLCLHMLSCALNISQLLDTKSLAQISWSLVISGVFGGSVQYNKYFKGMDGTSVGPAFLSRVENLLQIKQQSLCVRNMTGILADPTFPAWFIPSCTFHGA